MSESLKSNTTLTKLNLRSEDKRKKTYKRYPSAIHFLPFSSQTDNDIGDTGTAALSESLKSNTTLTQLNLNCEDKRKKTHKISISNSLFSFSLFITTASDIGETGATSLGEALKPNTTLTQLNLFCEDKIKKTHKRHPSTIHSSFLFTSTGNNIGESGATSLSDALKSNTTLTELDL